MRDTLHIGFTGTRHGMTCDQWERVIEAIGEAGNEDPIVAHHGCCVGADVQFHRDVRRLVPPSELRVIGHPGPDWPNGPLCAEVECDEMMEPAPYMWRNLAIVSTSNVMIAAPLENEPQPRGGTWATIRMALKALRAGKLRALYVVGREGQLLNHEEWK
jgi:hypothetical protein